MKVIFLFIDGVGLGGAGKENPFHKKGYNAFQFMAGAQAFTKTAEPVKKNNHFLKGVDANLDVEGLPQSGTGQAALFSGENAAKVIGKHFGPFPHSKIKYLLKEESIFLKAQEMGKDCYFINAYPDIFFEKAEERSRWTCTTLMAKCAGVKLSGPAQVKNEEAVTAGITQQVWREQLGIEVPAISAEAGARRLLKQSHKYNLLLHEYYLTDKAGHSKSHKNAERYLTIYNRFLWTIIKEKADDTTVVLSSDHGNIEDLSRKTHTRNKVPLFAYGKGASSFCEAKSILDVTPGILEVMNL